MCKLNGQHRTETTLLGIVCALGGWRADDPSSIGEFCQTEWFGGGAQYLVCCEWEKKWKMEKGDGVSACASQCV